MQLILDLVNAAEPSASPKSSVTFQQAGGSIGRSETATWQLSDHSRHISGVHAEISYEEGVYYLTDRSTNGTFDVGRNARLQKNAEYPIAHGDRFRMGDFIFKARILVAADHFSHQTLGAPEDIAHLIPDDEFLAEDPLLLLDKAETLSDDFDLTETAMRNDDVYLLHESSSDLDCPIPSATLFSTSHKPIEAAELAELDITDPIPLRPIPAKDNVSLSVASEPMSAQWSNAEMHLMQALGESLEFDFKQLTSEQCELALQNLGLMIKQTIQGLQQVLRTRADIKNKLRLGGTIVQESSNNPLKLMGNYTQALNCMLLGQMGYLSGSQAVRQALKDIQAHQVASFAASRTMSDAVFDQLSPTRLTYRFENAGKASRWGNKAAYYWQQYQLHHQQLSSDQEWRQSQFIQDYARVYEEQTQYINAAWSDV
ncbi:type VI secretion system-associated FHA domain protein TagH [Tolumonas lignilytica]|uniref:type VI secretion system-associated FHA domain protein TagH n=1 Tax=Tolumonas lignilytica TaxID=1283284 RepID=UPI000463BF27|nr:type VI secretion system-associated FHA domain protein TagH [Tolumonas lignilytica]